MSKPLSKDPAKALQELREFQKELQKLQTKYFFSEMHSADEDNATGVMAPLHKAERASMDLLDKLVDLNKAKSDLGCKVRGKVA